MSLCDSMDLALVFAYISACSAPYSVLGSLPHAQWNSHSNLLISNLYNTFVVEDGVEDWEEVGECFARSSARVNEYILS